MSMLVNQHILPLSDKPAPDVEHVSLQHMHEVSDHAAPRQQQVGDAVSDCLSNTIVMCSVLNSKFGTGQCWDVSFHMVSRTQMDAGMQLVLHDTGAANIKQQLPSNSQ